MLDAGRVAWADSSGNNRLDSFENVVQNASVALLFLINYAFNWLFAERIGGLIGRIG